MSTFKKADYINEIDSLLSEIERSVENSNQLGNTDIDNACEDFYRGLLNIVFTCGLNNQNTYKINYPGIDLADEENKIAFQITANKAASKIANTLDIFENREYYKKFDYFYIFIITRNKPNYRKDFNLNKYSFKFSVEDNVLDNKYVLGKLRNLDLQIVYDVLQYIKKEIGMITLHTSLANVKKPSYDNKYIYDRQLCLNDDYHNNLFLYTNCTLSVEEFLNSTKNKSIILSDAGLGKSELCKHIANKINEKETELAVYYRLNSYYGQTIDEIKGKDYQDIDNSALTFVLDGYDEIEDRRKQEFINKLESFLSNNTKSKVILSCRTNFYGDYGKDKFKDFNVYRLLQISDQDLNSILAKHQIEAKNFKHAISNAGMSSIMHNPFYLECLIKMYNKNTLPNKKNVMNDMINIIIDEDNSKFANIDLSEDKKDIVSKLKCFSFCLSLLERTSLSVDEYRDLIDSKQKRKMLEHTSLLSIDNNDVSFIHNNFFEYYTSELLRQLSVEQIKNLVTINDKAINKKWINVLNYLLIDDDNDELVKMLADISPEILFSIETNTYSKKELTEIFIKIIDSYNSKRMVIPYGLFSNNDSFEKLLNSKNIIRYALDNIKTDSHIALITNSLDILEVSSSFETLGQDVKTSLLNVIKDTRYDQCHKRKAFNILTDKKLLNDSEFVNLADYNKASEGPELRAAYYNYINCNINSSNLSIVFEGKNKPRILSTVNYETDENGYTISSEHFELDAIFDNLLNLDLVNALLNFIDTLKIGEADKILTKNRFKSLCSCVDILDLSKDEYLKLFLHLFSVINRHYLNENLSALSELIDKKKLKLQFFKVAIKEIDRFYNLFNIMDDKCANYFLNEYRNQSFNDNVAWKFLVYSNIKNNDYKAVNDLYCSKKGIDYIQSSTNRKDYRQNNQDYFDSMFDENLFISNITAYLNLLNIDSHNISIDKIKEKEEDNFDLYNEHHYISHFLKNFTRDNNFSITDVKNMNWDYFILANSYMYINTNNPVNVTSEKKEKIIKICKKLVRNVDFRNAIKRNGNSFTCNSYAIYLSYFGVNYDIDYSRKVLLDMINFNWDFNDYQSNTFNYLKGKIDHLSFKERVVDNIKNIYMDHYILKDHIKYCDENNISNLTSYLFKYLNNANIFSDTKSIIVDYIIKDKGIDYLYDFLNKLDFETRIIILNKANIIAENKWYLYTKKKYSNSYKQEQKLEYLKLLIKNKDLWALKRYKSLIKKANKYIDNNDYDTFSKIINEFNDIRLLDTVLNIYLITLFEGFKDIDFHSLNSACTNSLYKIAISNVDKDTHKSVIKAIEETINKNNKSDKIYNLNYVVERINDYYLDNCKNRYSIKDAKNKYIELFGDIK